MASNLHVGEKIFVPISTDASLSRHNFALYETIVLEKNPDGRSIKFTLPSGETSDWIGTSKVRKNTGILIFNIGDLQTETSLLDPMAKSILQFCRLLLSDDSVRSYKIRSIAELEWYWKESAAYRYVILIGHGERDSLKFGVNDWVNSEDLFQLFDERQSTEKIFLSLCCKTGYREFAGKLSKLQFCEHFIAPFNELNGAVASQYCQSFLNQHLLHGHTAKIAHNKALLSLAQPNLFRLWKDGYLE